MIRTRRNRCRPDGSEPALPAAAQGGYILIAALAMLTTLLGAVLLCLYPLAYEARQAPRHREALRRFKAAERGLFGRLADQAGGVHSAAGGYFSDTGSKMIVSKLVQIYNYSPPRLRRAMEFWFYRRFSAMRGDDGNNEGAEDIYRYDRDSGFWVGYRGKRYIVRPAGEEHWRRPYELATYNAPEGYPDLPQFRDGFSGHIEMSGDDTANAFYLCGSYDSALMNIWYDEDKRPYEHKRYFNPVEKLVVRVNDRRASRTNLSAALVYAKQPDPESVNDFEDLLPRQVAEVVSELPTTTTRSGTVTTFVFLWEWDSGILDPDSGSQTIGVCEGHTFEIGLKKLVLMEPDGEDDLTPVYAVGITIPPSREYQCTATDSDVDSCTGCKQPYCDQFTVEIDYDG